MERVNYRRLFGRTWLRMPVGMCLLGVATLWLSTIANGQQAAAPATENAQPLEEATALQDLPNQDLENPQPGLEQTLLDTQPANEFDQQQLDQSRAFDQPGAADRTGSPPNRSMTRGTQREPAEEGMMAEGRPGELGVFLIQSAGPGVAIGQVAGGSAAEAAGLEPGDVIMQINTQSVDEPREITRIIRSIPIGEMVALHIWRDGQEQDIQATLQAARERNRVGYRGSDPMGSSGDLASRTQRLEEQLNMIMQELQQLRQEVAQFRAVHPGSAARQPGLDSQPVQPLTPPAPESAPPNATQPGLDKAPGQPATTESDTGLPF